MQDDLLTLARPEIVTMRAYASARTEQHTGKIWLDANENPWNDTKYNRYPEPQPASLMLAFSALYNVKKQQLIITRGSDEGIDLLVRLFCNAKKDKVMVCPPTYGMYKIAATIQGVTIIETPLIKENNFSIDRANILRSWQTNTKIIFLCSPNNPTGNLLNTEDILTICKTLEAKSIVVVDEAYIEFSMRESLVKYLDEYPNLVILRTLSKAYGLAGIRCGVTIANIKIIQLMKKMIAPYPLPATIERLILQTLQKKKTEEQIKVIVRERNKLYQNLSILPSIKKIWKSEANFLLFEAHDAKKIFAICLSHGLVLRNRSNEYGLNNCIRVTVGKPRENKLLLEVIANG